MAAHPTNPRGTKRKPKRPGILPSDRVRVAALENAVEELQSGEPA